MKNIPPFFVYVYHNIFYGRQLCCHQLVIISLWIIRALLRDFLSCARLDLLKLALLNMPTKKKITEIALDADEVSGAEKLPAPKTALKSSGSGDKRGNLDNLRHSVMKEISDIFAAISKAVDDVELFRKKTMEDSQIKEEEGRRLKKEEDFNLEMQRRKKQAEFEEKLSAERRAFEEEMTVKESELRERETQIKTRETEYNELKKEAALFEEKVEKIADSVKKSLTQELKREFDNEKRFIIQKYDSETKLFTQQIKSLQQTLQQRDKDMDSLKVEKDRSTEQLRDIAVAVVRGKENADQPLK